MKKTTRVLVALLALTLVTSCFVGGTFAKYVTDIGSATDNARVAKWGVTGSITGEAFAKTYEAHDGTTAFDITVESSTEDKVVAPGTNGTFTGIALSGKPEVAVKVTKTATVDLSDWEVDGAYYCPLAVTIEGTTLNGNDYDSAAEFAADIKAKIEAGTGEYAANTDLSTVDALNGDYTWAWAFENGVEQTNALDTKLGDKAVNATADTITITVAAIVEQID